MKQKTLKKPLRLNGVGLHGGKPCQVSLEPAPIDTGIIFAKDGTKIPAEANFVVSTNRGTSIGKDGVIIGTVEHLLSALKGLGVDNVLVSVEGDEIPALDGSAKNFCEAILNTGLENQGALKTVWKYSQTKSYVFALGASTYKVGPSEKLTLSVTISYPNTPIGVQEVGLTGLEDYVSKVSAARTYCLEEEVEVIRGKGLGQGGNLKNNIVVRKNEFLTEEPLRYPDECVRHKALDLLGDLALLGPGDLCFNISSFAPGHHANVALVKELKKKLTVKKELTL